MEVAEFVPRKIDLLTWSLRFQRRAYNSVYSRTSVAGTLMAHLARLFQILS